MATDVLEAPQSLWANMWALCKASERELEKENEKKPADTGKGSWLGVAIYPLDWASRHNFFQFSEEFLKELQYRTARVPRAQVYALILHAMVSAPEYDFLWWGPDGSAVETRLAFRDQVGADFGLLSGLVDLPSCDPKKWVDATFAARMHLRMDRGRQIYTHKSVFFRRTTPWAHVRLPESKHKRKAEELHL
jgi:hypothetical protein